MEKQKQPLLAAVLIGLILCSVLLFVALRDASPGPNEPTVPPQSTTIPTEPTVVPTVPTEPSIPATLPSEDPAKIVIWQHDETLLAAWQAVAEEYTAKTGIQVTVKASNLCHDSLPALGEEDSPTIFCLHDLETSSIVQEYCLDLTGDSLLHELSRDSFTLSDDNGIWGVASNIESYGLIYNASLLARAGYTDNDIKDFTSLANIAEFITKNTKTLGFSAFTAPDLTSTEHGSLLCLLAGLHVSDADLRSFWDLHTDYVIPNGTGIQDFLNEKTVFYLGGTWDYSQLSSMEDYNLRLLPVYTPTGNTNLGLYHSCTGYWCVNRQARQADIDASLDFLRWLVKAEEGNQAPVDQLGLLSPYKDAQYAGNPLEEVVREYLAENLQAVDWNSCDELTPEELSALGEALATYSANPSDKNWAKVEEIWQE